MLKGFRLIAMVVLFTATLVADTVRTSAFFADMSTANEVPPATGVTASAKALIGLHLRYDSAGNIVSGVVEFDVDYSFADPVTITGLHIHPGAAGVNGPVVIGTDISSSNSLAAQGSGNIQRQVRVESGAALAALSGIIGNPGGYYVNLHTTTFPGGIIRGQLSPAELLVVRAVMSPANEVPPVSGLDATGSGSIFILAKRDAQGVIERGLVFFEASYRFPSAVTLTGMHIHPGAAGVNGSVAISSGLSSSNSDAQNVTQGTIQRDVEVTSGAALDALRGLFSNPSAYYLNLHTTANTGGAMRGQVQATAETSFDVTMTPGAQVPPVTGLEASGIANISLHYTRDSAGEVNSATAIFNLNYSFPGSTAFNGLHIHTAPAGQNGSIVIDSRLGTPNAQTDADGVGNFFQFVDIGPSNATALAAVRSILSTPQNHYLNLHTTVNAAGAVRGQLPAFVTAGPPAIASGAVWNNASYNLASLAVAPGMIAAIFGTNLTDGSHCTPATLCFPRMEGGRLMMRMAGAQVTINGVPVPPLYAVPGQIGVQIPTELTGTSATIQVTVGGQISPSITIPVEPYSPGIFATNGQGTGAGAIHHLDATGTRVTAQTPAQPGELVDIYCTGLGQVNPPVPTGVLPSGNVTVATPTVTVDGVPADVEFSGLSGCCAGLYQVRIRIPANARSASDLPVVLTIGGKASNTVTIAVGQPSEPLPGDPNDPYDY